VEAIVSGPLAEWVTVHYPELNTHARFVLTVLALAAKHDGSDANLTRGQIRRQTGLSEPAISRALRQIENAKAVAQGPIPGRGQPRSRQVRIWWCDRDCFTCDLLAGFQKDGKVIATDNLSRRKVISSRTKVVTSDNPLRTNKGLTAQQYQAMRWAQQSAPRDLDPDPPKAELNGSRAELPTQQPPATQPAATTSTVLTVEPATENQEAAKEAKILHLPSFKADRTSRPDRVEPLADGQLFKPPAPPQEHWR
jgi:hypothetical protein